MKAWLAPLATAASLLACYGTLVVVAALGFVGVGVALNERVWAVSILVFAWIAVGTLILRMRAHRRPLPLVLAIAGAGLVTYVMVGPYSRGIELAGFALLCAGTLLDWRVGRR